MPTGYTAAVQDGTIADLRTFAMQCARAFGALITMRGEPHDAKIPLKFEPDTRYCDGRIAEAQEKLSRLPLMSSAECDAAATADYEQAMTSWRERANTREVHRQRYEDMIAKVRAWQPPEAVSGLRDFMAEQLITSIDHDCNIGKYDPEPTRKNGPEWLVAQIEEAQRDLSYGTEERAKEIARVADRNLWLDALRVSLAETP